MRSIPESIQPALSQKEMRFFNKMEKNYNTVEVTRYYYNSMKKAEIDLHSMYSYVISIVFADTISLRKAQSSNLKIANYILDSILISKDFLDQIELQGVYNKDSFNNKEYYFIFKYDDEKLVLTYESVN